MFTYFRNRRTSRRLHAAELTALAVEYEEIAREHRIAAERARRHDELLINPRQWERRPRRTRQASPRQASPRRSRPADEPTRAVPLAA
jgi:hypothetical protein